MNDNKKEEVNGKKGIARRRILYFVVLVVIFVICFILGYNFVENLGEEKETTNKKVESNKIDQEDEELPKENLTEESVVLISEEAAEELIKKYHYEYTLSGTQPQYSSGYTENVKFELSYHNSFDKTKKVKCSDYANVKKVDSNLYTLKGKYEDVYYCDKKTNAISYDDLNNSYKNLFGNDKDLERKNYYPYVYNSEKAYFVELYPIVGNPYQKENLYGVQDIKVEDNKLVIDVGYAEFEYVEGSIDGDYSSCNIYSDDEERMAECISVIEDTVHFSTTITNYGKVSYTWDEFNDDNFIKSFKEKYLADLPTYTFVFEKENDNYILVDFYQN